MNNLCDVTTQYSVDIILGDFNINYFDEKESEKFRNRLESELGYKQIVKKPTFLTAGSLLDHVYIRE